MSSPNRCKECVKRRVREHRARNIESIRAYDRRRPNRDERRIANQERYRQTVADPEKRQAMWERSKAWRQMNAEKRAAHIAVGNAIRRGDLAVKPCEVCGYGVGVHAHHEDYSKPLDVTWLCRRHHAERHRDLNEQRRRAKG